MFEHEILVVDGVPLWFMRLDGELIGIFPHDVDEPYHPDKPERNLLNS